MPESRRRKKGKGWAYRPSASPARPAPSANWGASSLDRIFTTWFNDRVMTTPFDADLATVGLATMLWAAAGDPARLGLNQCLGACQFIAAALNLSGFAGTISVVQVTVESDLGEELIGSDRPVFAPGIWSGHAVLLVPEFAVMLDPTIGQGRFADSDERKYPVLLRKPQFAKPVVPGSVLRLGREERLWLSYHFIDGIDEVLRSPEFAGNDREIRKVLEELGDDFATAVADLRGSTLALGDVI